MQSVHTLLKLAQLRWAGHVTSLPEERLPKKILFEELEMGKHSHGGQKKRYKDTLKASLKDFNIPTEPWELIAQDRAVERPHQVLMNMRQKESAKPSRNVHSAKPELRHHYRSWLALTSIVPSATDSLELELV